MIVDCTELVPDRLWVGGLIRPDQIGVLKQMGITTVLSLQSDSDLSGYGLSVKKLVKAYESADLEFRRIPTDDFSQQALAENLPKIISELESALQPRWARVYLHCSAGVNRAPTAAAAFLVRSRGVSAQEAFDLVCSRRHCNPYLKVIEQYAASLRTTSP
jgi:protein-tyrosine phosphatase